MTKTRFNFQISMVLFLLLCAVSLDYLMLSVRADSATNPASKNATIPAGKDSVSSPETLSQRIQIAVEKIRPSLVTIDGSASETSHLVLPPRLPEFFSGEFNPLNEQSQMPSVFGNDADRPRIATGLIVSEDGFVWTNSDIVQGLDSVTVTLQDGTSYGGKVILNDQQSGLGIVKIDARNLPVARSGDENREPMITAGLTSTVMRPNSASGTGRIRCSFHIPADFAGCALINLNGELIGVDTSLPASRPDTFTVYQALDIESANLVHQRATQIPAHKNDGIEHSATSKSSNGPCESTRKGKEGKRSQIEMFSRLFSVPSSQWNSDSIASSLRHWLGSWQDADRSPPHADQDTSESR